jgi:hypothetical protein
MGDRPYWRKRRPIYAGVEKTSESHSRSQEATAATSVGKDGPLTETSISTSIAPASWPVELRPLFERALMVECSSLTRAPQGLSGSPRELGCGARGAHLHVRRRTTELGSSAKSRSDRIVPIDAVTVFCADRWFYERDGIAGAESSATVLVNVAGENVGRPLRVDHVNSIVTDLCRRARLERPVTPHMLRHAWATGLAGVADLAVVKDLLGHRHLATTARYVHPEWEQLRAAVDRAYLESAAVDAAVAG